MASKNKAKKIKCTIIITVIVEFIYILLIPELLGLYIFMNTILILFILYDLIEVKK